MMWHVVFEERDGKVVSRAARSRDYAIHVACELLSQAYDVRRILNPMAGLSRGLSWTGISTKAGSPAYGVPQPPSE